MMAMASDGDNGHHGSTRTINPLKEDPVLQQLLEQSLQEDPIQDFDAFKALFVQRLESLLEPQGIVKARQAYETIKENLKELAAIRVKLQSEISQGHLGRSVSVNDDGDSSANKVMVAESDERRKTLNQAKQAVMETTRHIREWIPVKDEDETNLLGYNRYQLGAVLVQDGFDVYRTMSLNRDMLKQAFEACNVDVLVAADGQDAWQAVAQFEEQIQCFCDFVRNDLGLHEVMRKSKNMAKDASAVVQRPDGDGGGGNDDHTEQEHSSEHQGQPNRPSAATLRRRRSLLGSCYKSQQSQPRRARRRSLDLDSAFAPFGNETVENDEKSFDTIEYYDDDEDACAEQSTCSIERQPQPNQPSPSFFSRRRRRSLLGNSGRHQQSHPHARRGSLDLDSAIASLEDATVESSEKSFDTIEYYSDDDDVDAARNEKSFDTLEYYTDDEDGDDGEYNAASFEKVIVENEKSFDAFENEEDIEYDEETLQNSDRTVNTQEYVEERQPPSILDRQEDALVDSAKEGVFTAASDEKVSESAVDGEARGLNEVGDENEEGPQSFQPPRLGNQEIFADELGNELRLDSGSDPSAQRQEPPPAHLDASAFAASTIGTRSIGSHEKDDDAITLEVIGEGSYPLLQFDPSVITCSSPGITRTSLASNEDDGDVYTHEVIREDSDPYLQFDPSDVACSIPAGTSIVSNENDNDSDIHEVIREDSDPYLQFDPSETPGIKIVSNDPVNNMDIRDVACEDTGEHPSARSPRGKRIRKMFGSLVRRPSKLRLGHSEDDVASPSRTADGNEVQSCSNELDAAGNLRDSDEDDKKASSQGTSQPPLPSIGLTRQSEKVLSQEQPLPRAAKPKEQSVEQAFQCDAVAPPSPSNKANRFNGIFSNLSLKALSPRRESKSKSKGSMDSPVPPSSPQDSEPTELQSGSQVDQQEFQSDDEAPPSPTNEANRFHEIFKGLIMSSHTQEQVDCLMPPLHQDESAASTLSKPPLSIFKSTKYHAKIEEQQMMGKHLPVEELHLQSSPLCDNLHTPVRTSRVSFKLPENHGKSTSAGRGRRRPGSPRRRRPGSPTRKSHSCDRAVSKAARNSAGDPIRWDLRVRFGSPAHKVYNKPLRHDDCVLVPDFFGPTSDWSMYYKLLVEIRQLQEQNITGSNLIQCPADVGKHLVCPTPMKSKTFKEVCKKVCKYFDIKLETVQFTLNWYRDSADIQKPRHDEEAYENDKPSIRNITVGISFGAERELSLEKHEGLNRNKLEARISIPQSNNCICTIGRDVNIRFKNGLVQSANNTGGGTIAIIIWGQVQNVKEERGSPAQLKRDPALLRVP